MSNSIMNQINVVKTGRGRTTGKETAKVRRAVVRVVSKADGTLTTNDVAKECKQKKVRVIAALRWLEQKGFVKKVGQKKVKAEKAGRPSAVWAIDADYQNIDRTNQRNIQNRRKYVRAVATLSPVQRKEMVEGALQKLTELQTEDEVEVKESLHENKQGYIKADAKRGVNDSQKGELTLGDVNYWITRIYKYRNQLQLDVDTIGQ